MVKNPHPPRTALAILIAILKCGVCFAQEAEATYQVDTPITLASPMVIELQSGAAIKSVGSKVLVEPVNITWKEFLDSVTWERGAPGYMEGTKPDEKNFNFDLTQELRIIRGPMALRISRVTIAENDNDQIQLVILAKSPVPVIRAAGRKVAVPKAGKK